MCSKKIKQNLSTEFSLEQNIIDLLIFLEVILKEAKIIQAREQKHTWQM